MKKTSYQTAIFSIVKACLIFAAAYMLLTSSVMAQCSTGQWDVSGKWVAFVPGLPGDKTQSQMTMSGIAVWRQMDGLIQTGETFSGTATFVYQGFTGFIHAKVTGTIKGDHISLSYLRVSGQKDDKIEAFEGKIGADGKIEGTANVVGGHFPKGDKWYSSRPMKCISGYKPISRLKITPTTAPTPTPPPPVKTVKTTGHPIVAANEPSPNAPMISATPNNGAFVPGKIAHTVIRWDGGPDHPYAELWVRVNDEDEKFVIEQGKGSRQMVVEPGKTYLYILTDSGETLATVTVKFHQ